MNSETAVLRNGMNNKVPNTKRAIGYFRVSSEEQVEGYSISAQERAYRQYVEAHGYTSVGEYRDEGKSARTDHIKRRPQFAQMLQDAQEGLFDVIVVHKMDRFSRSMRVAVQAFEQLGKCNVGLVSVSEPNLDYSTPQGKLFMHMLWALAQFYSDNLAQEVRKGKVERKQQGLYNGFLPFGAVKSDKGVPEPDQRDLGLDSGRSNYDGLLLLFQMAADEKPCKSIAEELNRLGYRTTGNRGANLFTKDTVAGILRNRFYLGELPDGEYGEGHSRRGNYTKGLQGQHAPLIPVELWEAAQRGKTLNSLSGLLTCSYCGGKLHIHTGSDGKTKVYCYRRGQGIANHCKQRSTFLSVYEGQVEQYLSSIRLPEDYQQMILDAYKREDEQGPGFDKQRQDLENKLKRLKRLYTWGDLSEEEYREQRDQMRNELAALPPTTISRRETIERLATYLQDVGNAWRDATQEQRNRLAKVLFESIRVENHNIKGVTPQTELTVKVEVVIAEATGVEPSLTNLSALVIFRRKSFNTSNGVNSDAGVIPLIIPSSTRMLSNNVFISLLRCS
jgi:site-specific DNA recombinase